MDALTANGGLTVVRIARRRSTPNDSASTRDRGTPAITTALITLGGAERNGIVMNAIVRSPTNTQKATVPNLVLGVVVRM
jgi:hypothetical protein